MIDKFERRKTVDHFFIDEQGVLVEYIPKDYEEDMYVVVPNGVKVISEKAFQYFSRLKSITLPDTVEEIEMGAFFECTNLNTINIPESVKNIGDEAFARCYALADTEGFIIVNDVIYGFVGNKEEIIVPQHVTRISARAFSQRQCINKVVLPEGLLSIGEEAFYACSNLQEINKPASLKEIGDYAFEGTKLNG